jgi:hypothetical protein
MAETASQPAQSAAEAARDLAGQAQERAGELYEQASERAGEFYDQASDWARDAYQQGSRYYNEMPSMGSAADRWSASRARTRFWSASSGSPRAAARRADPAHPAGGPHARPLERRAS